jgi:hypothetical protein
MMKKFVEALAALVIPMMGVAMLPMTVTTSKTENNTLLDVRRDVKGVSGIDSHNNLTWFGDIARSKLFRTKPERQGEVAIHGKEGRSELRAEKRGKFIPSSSRLIYPFFIPSTKFTFGSTSDNGSDCSEDFTGDRRGLFIGEVNLTLAFDEDRDSDAIENGDEENCGAGD